MIHSVVNSMEMFSLLHIPLNSITELMSGAEIMSGAKSRKWLHQKPTNQAPDPSSDRNGGCMRHIPEIFSKWSNILKMI